MEFERDIRQLEANMGSKLVTVQDWCACLLCHCTVLWKRFVDARGCCLNSHARASADQDGDRGDRPEASAGGSPLQAQPSPRGPRCARCGGTCVLDANYTRL